MNRYESSMPRTASSVAAVAMAALILGLTVVLPAKVQSGGYETRMLAGSRAATLAPTDVTVSPATIEVFGVREQETAFEPVRNGAPKHKQQS